MTVEEMKQRKKELGYTNQELADLSGVPLSTVSKLFSGETSAPRRSTLLALESVLAASSAGDCTNNLFMDPGISYQTGSTAAQKKQGDYTLEDYLALPDDQRVELIDGVFYDMAAPFVVHQFIATQIGHQLMGFVEGNNGPCKPVLSPVDVQLDKDDKTVVQPDVLIICKPEILIKNGRVFGAPDFIIEILSKSTRKKDITLKLYKYANAGVREYWIIDPDSLTILVHDLENDKMPVIYNFTSHVPVKIWNEEFSVDFNKVYEYIKEYL